MMLLMIEAISSLRDAVSAPPPETKLQARDQYIHTERRPMATYSRLEAPGRRLEAQLDVRNIGNEASRQATLRQLAARDRYVRIHEFRHAAALGAYAGRIQYQFKIGPDGKAYAIGGYTEVNAMPAATTEQSLAKARILRAAAVAGGECSGGDLAIAAQAQDMERHALAQVATD